MGERGTAAAGTWIDAYALRAFDDLPAVVERHRVITSRELTGLAVTAGEWLDAVDAPPDRPIAALVSTTRAAFALAITGAASGRPIAPLSVRSTAAETGRILDALGPALLVAEPAAVDLARRSAAGRSIEVLELPAFDVGDARAFRVAPGVDGASTAAVLHTSGTSGQPKPVPYPQHRLLLRTRVNSGVVGLGPGRVYATASPFHHIAGLGMLFVALGSGAAVCPLTQFSADAWEEVIDLGATHALLVPSMIDHLLDEGRLVRGNLQCLQYGASRIDPGTLRRLLGALPGVDLVQIYGQTEGSPITVLTTDDHRRAAAGEAHLLGSAGRAAPGVTLRVHEPDADGIGEVWARADHLMKPDADGWLRTGDLGSIDADGCLTLAGRQGDMIIRGGENVSPAEVEEVLRRHSGVADIAVVGIPDHRLGQVVAAYVVPVGEGTAPTPDELHAFAREVLAGFKVPQRWTFLAELPRNATGKVLKRELVASVGSD
jgi:acyl-CoA synthetase (AMP-forming)/AMP-acid ligase II